MNKSIILPTLLLIVFVGALGGLRYMMWKQTQPEHEEPVSNADMLKAAQAEAKKATKEPGRTAVVETSRGTIKFVLYEKDVSNTTNNFVSLALTKFYDGSTFHRVEPTFVIQGGKPKNEALRPPPIKLELAKGLVHEEGAVAMARADDPHSGNCEFYITLSPRHELDQKYAVFGKVIEGMDVVKKIKINDAIKSVYILDKSGKKVGPTTVPTSSPAPPPVPSSVSAPASTEAPAACGDECSHDH